MSAATVSAWQPQIVSWGWHWISRRQARASRAGGTTESFPARRASGSA